MTSVFLTSKNSKYCSTFSPELKKIILKRQISQSMLSDLGFSELVGSKKGLSSGVSSASFLSRHGE